MQIKVETTRTDLTTISAQVGEKTISVLIREDDGIFSNVALTNKKTDSSIITLNAVALDSAEEIIAARSLLAEVLKRLEEKA